MCGFEYLDGLRNKEHLDNEDLKMLRKCAGSDDSEVRAYAAELLVMSESDLSKQILLKLAEDENSLVRINAYDSLSVFADEYILNYLFVKIEKEADDTAITYLILAFTDIFIKLKISPDEYILYFKELMSDDLHINTAVCRFMVLCGLRDYINNLIDYVNADDYHVRIFAVSTLSELADDGSRDLITDTLEKRLKCEKAKSVIYAVNKALDSINQC